MEQHLEKIILSYRYPKWILPLCVLSLIIMYLVTNYTFIASLDVEFLLLWYLSAFVSGFYGIYTVVQHQNFDFYDTYFTTHKMGRKVEHIVPYVEVVQYNLLEDTVKGDTVQKLHFTTNQNRQFSISSTLFGDEKQFSEIKNLITQKAVLDATLGVKEANKAIYSQGINQVMLGIFLLILNTTIFNRAKEWKPLHIKDIKSITGTVQDFKKIKFDRSYYYDLTLEEYPDFKFRLERAAYQGFKEDSLTVNPIKASDQMILSIEKEAYDVKIAETHNAHWRDFYKAYNQIGVRELKKSPNLVYLKLEDYNRNIGDYSMGFLGILGRMAIVVGIVVLIIAFINSKK
jgi:hypothetical protein